jgi:hypothetical protein
VSCLMSINVPAETPTHMLLACVLTCETLQVWGAVDGSRPHRGPWPSYACLC